MIGALSAVRGTPLHPQWLSDRYHLDARRLLRRLRAGLVLDVGSGDSDNSASVGPGCRLLRLDYPPTQARYRRAPNVYGTAERLPFADGSADAVLLFEVLEHVGDDRAALAEVARVLKPDGLLFVSVPFIYPLHDLPHDFRRYTPPGLRRALEHNGLHIEQELRQGNAIVVALQLVNLALLAVVRGCHRRAPVPGMALALVVYPVCVAVNLLALPFVALAVPATACFGTLCVARRVRP